MTIISDEYKCIFVRNPKSASTSIENAFASLDEDSVFGSMYGDSRDNDQLHNWGSGHHPHHCIKRFVGEEKWNSYFKFGVVRDPVERFFSHYSDRAQWHFDGNELEDEIKWTLRGNEESRSNHGFYGDVGLNVDLITSKRLELKPFMQALTGILFWHNTFETYTQTSMLGDELDLIIPLDKIGDGWKKVQKVLGIDIPLGVDNISPRKNDFEMAEDVSAIHKEIFKNDFDLYNKVLREYE